jgi:hypothetical protein
MFAVEFRDVRGKQVQLKMCPKHRTAACRAAKTPAGKANRERNSKTEKGKASSALYATGDKRKEALYKYNHSEFRAATSHRYGQTDGGKASRKKEFAKWYAKIKDTPGKHVMYSIRKKMYKTLSKNHHSATLLAVTGFESSDAVKKHFELIFQDGMTWANYGTWHVGHHLPVAAFDPTDDDDMLSCWNPRNLAPQWADENHVQSCRLPDDKALVESLCDLFPKHWKSIVPDLSKVRFAAHLQ